MGVCDEGRILNRAIITTPSEENLIRPEETTRLNRTCDVFGRNPDVKSYYTMVDSKEERDEVSSSPDVVSGYRGRGGGGRKVLRQGN